MSDHNDCINSRRSERFRVNRGANILDFIIRSYKGEGQTLESAISTTLSDNDLEMAMYNAIDQIVKGNLELQTNLQNMILIPGFVGIKLTQLVKLAINQYPEDFETRVEFTTFFSEPQEA